MERLAEQTCDRGDERGNELSRNEIDTLLKSLPGWQVDSREGLLQLEREFIFKAYSDAVAFVNRVAEAAEQENHHPTIRLEWGRVTVTWWTHKTASLHRNDFIMAAKTDLLSG